MTAAEAMQALEGDRFAALTNLASNLKTFLRIAAAQPEVEALSRTLAHDPASVAQVVHRALGLSGISAEADREHEGDAALAVYLWLMNNHPQEFAQVAAEISRKPGQFFWARKVIHSYSTAKVKANGDGTVAKIQTTGEATEDSRSTKEDNHHP